jgi:alkanesulfonate monooxygenase SsuD/methylene tetrahydromethanopterin reductase-like flavin-dependent oxidoreductase (luciferase family)
VRSGYVIFPQANVESEPSPLPDTERMRRELDLVDLAGEIGFDEFWVTEHHFGDYNLAPSPLQLLAYVTGRFPGASIGTMVIVLPWNDPLRVVEQVVVLDYLSQGRLFVGFGKGDARREFNAFGVDLAEARQRFDENLAVVLRALETGALERDGDPRVEVRPQPRGSFSGRLYMAAGSPASLDRAAESGLGLLRIGLRSWEEVAEQVRRHRAMFVTAHGHDPPPTVTLTYGFVDRDPGRARELGSQYARAYRLSAIDHYELGSDAEGELEAFAGAQLWGTPDQVVEKAAYLAEATRTGHLAYAFRYAGVPYEDAISSMRLFAAEVAPRLREIPVP